MSNFNCPICVLPIQKEDKIINCPQCKFQTCKDCFKNYIFTLLEEANCMNCKLKWNLKFLVDNFGIRFVTLKQNSYRSHLENIWLEREKALLQETMNTNDFKIEMQLNKIDQLIKQQNNEIRLFQQSESDEHIKLILMKRNKVKLTEHKKQLYQNEHITKNKQFLDRSGKNFLCPCPKNNCKGLIYEEDYSCSVCFEKICSQCYNSLTNEHICNQEDIKTIHILKKDSKPCPTCATFIYKISGCDQMFCTKCKTVFDWKTLKVYNLLNTNVIVHNPHAQRLFNVPRTNLDENIACRTLIGQALYNDLLTYVPSFLTQEWIHIFNKINSLNNLNYEDKRRISKDNNLLCREGTQQGLNSSLHNLRKDYLKNKITEEYWRQKICYYENLKQQMDCYNTLLVIVQPLLVDKIYEHCTNLIKINSQNVDESKSDQIIVKEIKNKEHINIHEMSIITVDTELTDIDQNDLKQYLIKQKRKSKLVPKKEVDSKFKKQIVECQINLKNDLSHIREWINNLLKEELFYLGNRNPFILSEWFNLLSELEIRKGYIKNPGYYNIEQRYFMESNYNKKLKGSKRLLLKPVILSWKKKRELRKKKDPAFKKANSYIYYYLENHFDDDEY